MKELHVNDIRHIKKPERNFACISDANLFIETIFALFISSVMFENVFFPEKRQCFHPRGGGGTPILDLTGCAAQQGVLLR